MKKSNFLRTVLGVAAALMLTTGVFGQVADADYVQYDADRLAPTNIDYVTLKTGGTTMGYYALPDPVYHPNYNGGSGWALTPLFQWNWSAPASVTINKPGAANYVELTYTALGATAVTVAEQAPAAFGSCADATPTLMNVTLINPPAATITTADPAQACGNQAAIPVLLTFTETVPAALAGYAFAVSEVVDNIDAVGGLIGNVSTNATFLDFQTSGKLNTGNGLLGAASPYTYSFNTSALDVQGGNRTRYTYTLLKATDAPGAAADGIISAISEKSDYLAAAISTYAFTDNQIVIIVNPAPATGPIYYVPNNFAY